MLIRYLLAAALAIAMTWATAQEAPAVPPLQSPVTDMIGMLSVEQRTSLENVLTEYRARTGSQIAVLLVASTAPEAIEQFSIRVADAWKLGRKGVDDGVILIVAKDNPSALRRLRIEAGRGVQGTLTDAQSIRILQDVIAPHFRQSDYYGGLTAGVTAIAGLLDKEQLPGPQKNPGAGVDIWSVILPILLFAIFALATVASKGKGARGQLSSAGWGYAGGIILGSLGGSRSSGSGGGFLGGGGSFDGGGASGDW